LLRREKLFGDASPEKKEKKERTREEKNKSISRPPISREGKKKLEKCYERRKIERRNPNNRKKTT